MVRVFDESKYQRGTGAQGGQFVSKGGAKSSSLGFDSRSGRGAGYGERGGDDNVKKLQRALNKLGITDSAGRELAVDGKFGPKTTASLMRLQRRLGLKPDGKITPALLARIGKIKKTTTLTEPGAKKTAPKKASPVKKTAPVRAPAKKVAAPVRRSLGYSMGMDSLERHGSHNQKSHGNRVGKPNVAGKTGHAKTAEEARVGTNDVRLDDEVEIVQQPGTTGRGGHIGKKGRIVDLEGVRPIVELDDGTQVEVLKSQLKVARTRHDKGLDKELRDKMDRQIEESRKRTARLRGA
jgi:peptidoglycan hydrolase-like protein with peptidoglycan-binding domain